MIKQKVIWGSLFFFGLFFLVVSTTHAQNTLQCNLVNRGGINTPRATVNRDLQVNQDAFLTRNLYLGMDETQAPILTNTGATNLLFQTAGGNYLFEDRVGNRFAGIYSNSAGAPAATNSSRALVVNGSLEGYLVNGRNQLCINGSCVASWSEVNTAANGDDDTRCDAAGVCGQLCIGAACYNSWANAVQAGTAPAAGSTINIASNSLTVTSGGSIRNGGLYQVCNASGTSCVGTGRGVSKIIGGAGITVSPASGDGDVTVSVGSATPCAAGFIQTGTLCLKGNGVTPLITSTTSTHATWQLVDTPLLNGTNARFAIIKIFCSQTRIYLRRSGDASPNNGTTLYCRTANNVNSITTAIIEVNNTNQNFDWYVLDDGGGGHTSELYLVGYMQ